jgi:hypothetical protein
MELAQMLPQIVLPTERTIRKGLQRTYLKLVIVPVIDRWRAMIAEWTFRWHVARPEFVDIRSADPCIQLEVDALLMSEPVMLLFK